MNAAELLEAAADRIEKNGWFNAKGYFLPNGEFIPATPYAHDERLSECDCAWTAVLYTAHELADHFADSPTGEALDALRADIEGGVGIFAWNDSQESADVVTTQMRATAARLRAAAH